MFPSFCITSPRFLHCVFSLLKHVLLSANQIQEMFSCILLNTINCHYQLLGRLQRMDKGVPAAFRLSQCQKPLAIESDKETSLETKHVSTQTSNKRTIQYNILRCTWLPEICVYFGSKYAIESVDTNSLLLFILIISHRH